MPLTIVPYEPRHEPAVAAFNARGREHGAPFPLARTPGEGWLPKTDGSTVYRERFLALDGDDVRGGFTLRRQAFWLNGRVVAAANYQGPISEGIWDRRYMMAGVQMLRAALRDQPLLYALGMGGLAQPLPKQLESAKWELAMVPFRFRVLRPSRFLRHIRPLRKSPARALAFDLAARTGAGALAFRALHALRTRRPAPAGATAERVAEFGAWADSIWEAARGGYAFTAVRDRAAQNQLFGGDIENHMLRCRVADADVGWAVVRATPMRGDGYFGDMTVATLVDALALPGHEHTIVTLALRDIQTRGADIVVTNQSHAAWLGALREAGWLAGPSNFVFAASPALAAELGPLAGSLGTLHVNRADGDGPIHL